MGFFESRGFWRGCLADCRCAPNPPYMVYIYVGEIAALSRIPPLTEMTLEGVIKMNPTGTHPNLALEYEQINENFRFLADVRFKLLAWVPTLGGAAVFVLAHLGLEAGKAPASSSPELLAVLLVSLFGFLATLGITLYDQRNSELYNALIHRAKHLEEEFGVPTTPGGLKQSPKGGQFNERPAKGRYFIFQAGHDLALALIYGPLLGAWFFPILYSVLKLAGACDESIQLTSALVAAIAALGFTRWLIALDRHENQHYHAAAKRDGIQNEPGT
jgi:hypothetical protein